MTTSEPVGPEPVTTSLLALVFAGGDRLDATAHRRLRATVDHAAGRLVVIAADSGLHTAQDGGWPVDLVVGDLDSVDAARLPAPT